MPPRVIRGAGKVSMKKNSHKRTRKSKSNHQRAGAIYTFDLNDKIGGLAANVPLNGTNDGDCPNTDVSALGFTNYGLTKGGSRKGRKGRKGSKSHKSHKSHKKSKGRKGLKSKSSKKSKSRRS